MKNLQEYIGEQLAYPDKGVKFNPAKLNKVGLIGAYELLCDEYRRRLCNMWKIHFDESWWMAEKIGEGLFLCDWCIPFDMPMLRYVVENNVAEKDWISWCDFVESEIHDGREIPRINFYHWISGARPEMLND